jgi:hypothetical protein
LKSFDSVISEVGASERHPSRIEAKRTAPQPAVGDIAARPGGRPEGLPAAAAALCTAADS